MLYEVITTQVSLIADFPSAPAQSLNQEDIVGIEMGTDAAAFGRKTHHEIIQPGTGDEIKGIQEFVAFVQQMIDAGYQQTPAFFRQALKV